MLNTNKHVFDLIRPVSLDDLPEINSWYRKRKAPMLSADLMSPQGFFIPGVAAGFLIRTNTNVALLESFVSNPEASKADREQGLDKIAESLINAARIHGAVMILAITSHSRIKALAKKYNFNPLSDLEVWARRN